MNYLELLDKELKGTNWDLEHKRRYIYLRSCQLFSFDKRISYTNPFWLLETEIKVNNAKSLYNELRNREIDLENVKDKKATCFSWSKAYIKLNKELLGLKASYVENMFDDHAWTMMMGHKADATQNGDLTRVKMNLATYGYTLSTDREKFCPDENSNKKIKVLDQDIYYIGKDYVDFKKIFLQFKLELLTTIKDLDDMYNWWINKLMETYKSYQGILLDYEDASYCLEYLFIHLHDYSDLRFKGEIVNLFLDDDSDDWDFADLYAINYANKNYYYLLSKDEIGYGFKEISENEAYYCLRNYKGFSLNNRKTL